MTRTNLALRFKYATQSIVAAYRMLCPTDTSPDDLEAKILILRYEQHEPEDVIFAEVLDALTCGTQHNNWFSRG